MCYLFHPPSKPSFRRPDGFKACNKLDIFVPEDSSFHLTRRNVGMMKAGSISVCMNMACTTLNEDTEGDRDDTGYIPDSIQYPRALQRHFDLGRSLISPTPAESRIDDQQSGKTQQSSFFGETDLSDDNTEHDSLATGASEDKVIQETANQGLPSSSAVSPNFTHLSAYALTQLVI